MEKSDKPDADKCVTRPGDKRRGLGQEQKLKILETAKEIGIKEAAKLTGIHYTTTYDWERKLEARGREGFLTNRSPSPGRASRG